MESSWRYTWDLCHFNVHIKYLGGLGPHLVLLEEYFWQSLEVTHKQCSEDHAVVTRNGIQPPSKQSMHSYLWTVSMAPPPNIFYEKLYQSKKEIIEKVDFSQKTIKLKGKIILLFCFVNKIGVCERDRER